MRFKVNRKIMLEHLKTMVKIVPRETPIQELKGFLVEANEDDGYVYITATNFEVAIQRKFKPILEEGGSFVMDARKLVDILSLLAGDEVLFSQRREGIVEISAVTCTYEMRALAASNYPKPEIPFPNSTAHISGAKQFYLKTNAAVANNTVQGPLNGIYIDIKPQGLRVISCDAKCAAIAEKEMSCKEAMSFIIPKTSLSLLANAAGDEELEVGESGPFAIFMREGMLFSARKMDCEYINIDGILNSLKNVYIAKVEYDDLKNQILTVCDVAAMGSSTSYVKLAYSEDKVGVSTENDMAMANNSLPAIRVEGEGEIEFYYLASQLKDMFKTVEGTIMICVDKNGYLIVCDKYNKFLLTPMRAEAAKKQSNKFKERKSKAATKVEKVAA